MRKYLVLDNTPGAASIYLVPENWAFFLQLLVVDLRYFGCDSDKHYVVIGLSAEDIAFLTMTRFSICHFITKIESSSLWFT